MNHRKVSKTNFTNISVWFKRFPKEKSIVNPKKLSYTSGVVSSGLENKENI